MMRILKTFLFFITMVISLILLPTDLHSQQLDTKGYIQEIKQETIVLASNNILGGEVSSYQEENSSNFKGGSPYTLTFESNQNLFNKNKALLNGYFVHNLSANKLKVQCIRAP